MYGRGNTSGEKFPGHRLARGRLVAGRREGAVGRPSRRVDCGGHPSVGCISNRPVHALPSPSPGRAHTRTAPAEGCAVRVGRRQCAHEPRNGLRCRLCGPRSTSGAASRAPQGLPAATYPHCGASAGRGRRTRCARDWATAAACATDERPRRRCQAGSSRTCVMTGYCAQPPPRSPLRCAALRSPSPPGPPLPPPALLTEWPKRTGWPAESARDKRTLSSWGPACGF